MMDEQTRARVDKLISTMSPAGRDALFALYRDVAEWGLIFMHEHPDDARHAIARRRARKAARARVNADEHPPATERRAGARER